MKHIETKLLKLNLLRKEVWGKEEMLKLELERVESKFIDQKLQKKYVEIQQLEDELTDFAKNSIATFKARKPTQFRNGAIKIKHQKRIETIQGISTDQAITNLEKNGLDDCVNYMSFLNNKKLKTVTFYQHKYRQIS
ncbi:hypothetical protein GMMP15_1840001 [Candidatus Magnetomoraceae bacterium gMMP-15]